MYKYYDIIDQNKKIDIYDPKLSNYTEVQYKLPIEFFNKNSALFVELHNVFNTFCMITEESIFNCLEGRIPLEEIYDVISTYKNISLRRDNDFDGHYLFVDDFYRITNPSNYICENYLCDMENMLKVLIKLYPKNDYYKVIYNETMRVYDELRKTNCIVVSDPYIKIELPNSWYITRNGSLYNSMGKGGHKESNLEYPISDIQRGMFPCFFIDERNKYLEEYNTTKERGYITRDQYVKYLNWYGVCDSFINNRIYHKIIVDLVLGIIRAHVDLYEAFDKLEYSEKYEDELKKLFEMCNYQYDDLLVRFVGMSKVKASGLPFVCTTDTYEMDFHEYTERGYSIDLVDPIIVEDGEVKELSLDSHRKIKKILGK